MTTLSSISGSSSKEGKDLGVEPGVVVYSCSEAAGGTGSGEKMIRAKYIYFLVSFTLCESFVKGVEFLSRGRIRCQFVNILTEKTPTALVHNTVVTDGTVYSPEIMSATQGPMILPSYTPVTQ